MGNVHNIPKTNFEEIQQAIKNNHSTLLINTLPNTQQDCLIQNTIQAHQEEALINQYLQTNKKDVCIIIYGKNNNDETIYHKYKQFLKLGFINVKLYLGGMFEWLMLQDIYGYDVFLTTKKELDFLKYKP